MCLAPGPGEGTSSGETPQGPRKKRARVDPTVESVYISHYLSYHGLTWKHSHLIIIQVFWWTINQSQNSLIPTA